MWIEIAVQAINTSGLSSPSSQRVWIEIIDEKLQEYLDFVTLFTEGVDWNSESYNCQYIRWGHPLHRGCGLKSFMADGGFLAHGRHPLHRGCGLKFILFKLFIFPPRVTLFTEGVDWNTIAGKAKKYIQQSPSSQRVWIEMPKAWIKKSDIIVTLFTEGVDWNAISFIQLHTTTSSPSSQRVWIEITWNSLFAIIIKGHPLHRGCGLK